MSRGQPVAPVNPPAAAAAPVQPSELNVPVSGLSLDPEEQIIWKVFIKFYSYLNQFFGERCSFTASSIHQRTKISLLESTTVSNFMALKEAKGYMGWWGHIIGRDPACLKAFWIIYTRMTIFTLLCRNFVQHKMRKIKRLLISVYDF